MRTLLLALVAAAVPPALFAPCLGYPSPLGEAASPDAAARWAGVALASLAALLVFAAVRVRGGSDGAALAGALATALFPAMADSVLSPRSFAILVMSALAAFELIESLLVRRSPESGWLRGLGPAAAGVLWVQLGRMGADDGSRALVPAAAAFAPFAGRIAGLAAATLARRDDLARGTRTALAVALGAVLAASGWAAVERTEAWRDPLAFWDRAALAAPGDPVPLGVAAGAAMRAGDREGAVDRLRRFAEVANRARGAAAGREPARRAGADGAAAAAARVLEDPAAGGEEAAVEALRAAEALCPTSAATVRLLGETQLRRGEFVEAVVTLERATALDAADAASWEALARARLHSGRPQEAIEAALRARAILPASREVVVTLSEALLAVGRDAEALELLHDALFPLPGDPALGRAYADAHLRIARKETSAGEKGKARRRLLAGLEAVPGHEGCRELLARLNRQYDEERPAADRLLVPGPDGSVTLDRWVRHASWLCRWGRYDEAGAHFDDMVRRFGSLAEVHFHRGREFWESRGTVEGMREAVASYREAVARDPKHAEAWNRLWHALAVLGRPEEAAVAARRFLEYAPEHPDGVEAEAYLGLEPGDPPDAPSRAPR